MTSTQKKVPSSGPQPAKILIVGEAPGADEELRGEPFIGLSGQELTRMLEDAGIDRSLCRITNVCPYRPPLNDIEKFFYGKKEAKQLGLEEVHGLYPKWEINEGLRLLHEEIKATQPNVIIALGNIPLWALTGESGITRWRGSIMEGLAGRKVIPVLHPAAILRNWEWRPIAVSDLQRAERESHYPEVYSPTTHFQVMPTYQEVRQTLDALMEGPLRQLAVDIETMHHEFITCIGIAWSSTSAICIPFIQGDGSYWSFEEELDILLRLRALLGESSPHEIIGQNYLYDMQYMIRWWGFLPKLSFDTMIGHHAMLPGSQKSLDFLASLYLNSYCYWKDERSSPWEIERWIYNCKDCINTFQLGFEIQNSLEEMGLSEIAKWQLKLVRPVLSMMLRGVRVDLNKLPLAQQAIEATMIRDLSYVETALGHPLNLRSSSQLKTLFYTDFRAPQQINRKTGNLSCDEKSLEKIGKVEPLLRPICDRIARYRSNGVLLSTFLNAQLDADGRIRCSFNICGTETFRFSSSESVFGTGTNLQNVPPELRYLFCPDDNYVLFDCDLKGADAQVVAWEAGDEELKAIFRSGANIHVENCKLIFGSCSGDKDPNYKKAKMGVHLSNYGGKPRTLATSLGITIKEAEDFQRRWFKAHPLILEWHRRIQGELETRRYVENAFGYRRYFFDRIDQLLPEALAWIPQSSVAITIDRGMIRLSELPYVQLLLQVHDSLVFQIPQAHFLTENLPVMRNLLEIPIPYEDPLTIPVMAKVSSKSWGEAEGLAWHAF